ncbi:MULTISPECIES: variant leucine-rich repeat-containing protein [Actinomycetaceae]|uniref:variant leucine-rich repeat-containing protein n=1 Tax=Actinomycetaceae TaxID=2049 RepID=UPI000398618D|nr:MULTISPECIES: hypothetical protein [Actinomycetaceae]ERH32743.1 hypothetical protein HMPREF1980_00299 [Actinomyces sp. oral taxon 172 str. F0311]WLD78461.1 hypothetical protein QU663_02230 [Schaalia sp. HMT-172]
MEASVKHNIPILAGAGLIAIGALWFFTTDNDATKILPLLLILVGAGLAYLYPYFGPALLPDPLAAVDPEPWRTVPATNEQEAQAYRAWVEQAFAATQQPPGMPTAPMMAQNPPMGGTQARMNEAGAPQASMPPSAPAGTQPPAPQQGAAEEANRPVSIGPLPPSTDAAPVNQPISIGPLVAPEPDAAPDPQQATEPPAPQPPSQESHPPSGADGAAAPDNDPDMTRATPSPASRFTITDAIDPATPWDVQAEIARMRPDLWVPLSKNPSLYPDLRAWLDRHITNE